MVSRSNASKVIDIQDEIRTADGLSFNEPLKFTAKSSTIRSDKKRRGTTETQLSKNTNRSQIIDKDISDAVSQTCGIVLWNRDTLLRYGISIAHVSFRISNQIVVDNREYVAMISVYRCRIFRSTIIQFLNLSFRIPRIYFRIEYILVFVNFWYLKFYFFSHICSIYSFQFFYSFILLSIPILSCIFELIFGIFIKICYLYLFFVPYSLYCFSFIPFFFVIFFFSLVFAYYFFYTLAEFFFPRKIEFSCKISTRYSLPFIS